MNVMKLHSLFVAIVIVGVDAVVAMICNCQLVD